VTVLNFEQALVVELKTVTGLSTKVFPTHAPEGTAAPYATYESDDQHKEKSLEGFISSGPLHVTVDVLHNSYANMKTLAALVKTEIESWIMASIGTGGSDTGPYIQDVTFDELLPELFEPAVNLYRKSIGFTVYF
jgi:hypothetical protein